MEYVAMLNESEQQAIKRQVAEALHELGLSGTERNEALERAMSSRLSDLKELIGEDALIRPN